MRRSAVAFVVAVAVGFISQSALATEMPLKAPSAAPVLVYNWSGLYIGGNIGYGWSDADWKNTESSPDTAFFDYTPGQTFSHDLSGIIGGGQIGYNYQTGSWVFGIEALINAASIKGNFSSDISSGAGDDQFEARIKMLMLFTGRVGYAWDNFLVYGKAGIAVADVHASVDDTTVNIISAATGSGSDSRWLAGPTVGIGIEYGITPNLSLGLEYDYLYLRSASYQLGGGAGSYLWDVDISPINIVMARLNYRFNGLR